MKMNGNKKPGRLETMFKSRTYRNQLEKKIKEARKELRRFDRAVSSATRLQKKYDNRISQLREATDDISYELGLGTTDADKLLYMEEQVETQINQYEALLMAANKHRNELLKEQMQTRTKISAYDYEIFQIGLVKELPKYYSLESV